MLRLVDKGIVGYELGVGIDGLSMCRFLKPSGAVRLWTGTCITLGL